MEKQSCSYGYRCGLVVDYGGSVGEFVGSAGAWSSGGFSLVYIKQYQWPVFNLADSAIVVGAGLLIVEILFAKSRGDKEPVQG